MKHQIDGSIAVREQYLSRIRELPKLVQAGEITEIEANGLAWYLARAIRAETPNPIARRYRDA